MLVFEPRTIVNQREMKCWHKRRTQIIKASISWFTIISVLGLLTFTFPSIKITVVRPTK